MENSLSQTLADYIASVQYEDLPNDVIEFTKLCILDWLGNAIAGKDETPVKWIHDVMMEMGGAPQATAVTGQKTSVLQAALINGAASHIVELDDIHKGSVIHAATVVIPAAVACAEWKQKSGKDLITAVALGYEVCFRIGEAVTPSHYYYWHNTATCGTFGAACTAAKLLDLTSEQIAHTLGSAGTQAAGLWEFIKDGAMSKQLHTAKAAYNGTLSALLSAKGFTGAKHILEGDRGFFEAMSDDYEVSRITDQLGERFKIVENSFKIHASCRHTHAAIDLMLDLIQKNGINEESVQSVEVNTYKAALDVAGNPQPKTVYAAKFSISYCMALALVKKQAGLTDFTEENLNDPIIQQVLKKVKVQVSPTIEANYPVKWGAEVILTLENGQTFHGKADYPKGDPENPVTKDQLIKKFIALTTDKLSVPSLTFVEKTLSLESQMIISLFPESYSIESTY